MKKTLTLATLTILGGLALGAGAGAASAAPMAVNGLQSETGVTQVRMMHGDRMMKKRMMRKQMMKRRMMKKRMMNRGM